MRKLHLHKPNLIFALLGITAAILAFDPIIWLTKTWQDPSYDSSGFYMFLPVLGLFIWSFSSKRLSGDNVNPELPLFLLLITALIRLAGQFFAVNIIGAMTLVIDIYAIARLAGLDKRVRSISPFWLSVAFSFSLPLERMAQRIFGYGLQNISADGACFILSNTFDNVTCQGIRILINAQDVMVDLPCSGARAALLTLFFFSLIAAVSHFNFRDTIIGVLITIISAYLSNVLRICILSAGIGYPDYIGNINVMARPAHDMIGLFTLFLGGTPIILWARSRKPQQVIINDDLPRKLKHHGWWLTNRVEQKHALPLASVFLITAIGITQISGKAVDVSHADIPISLPAAINGQTANEIPLSTQEQNYFTAYGGSAKKASYGNKNLMIIKTSSPLRHLHAPDACLRGMGFDVDYIGASYKSLPTAIYKAVSEQGDAYRILVTFVSSDFKYTTTNISEAIWHWIQSPGQSWTAIQRISHWDDETHLKFDQDVMASLSLKTQSLELARLKEN